jgi:NADPH:quinone reductase-like Zn-dependent oxidoreductase
VDVVFPLAEAEAAHRLMESAGHNGKIVLQP